MKIFVLAMWICLLTIGVSGLLAQSGGGATPTDVKANQRKPEPSPTPISISNQATAAIDKGEAVDDGDVIKVNTQLVSITVRVLEEKNRFIAGMTKENFKIFEDGVEQDVALFSNEHQPFTVALLLDM